ncbi:hypothetical protein PMAYCL1PPCAC_19430, partial [Pristionchus mayeri]
PHIYIDKQLSCGDDKTVALFFDEKKTNGKVKCTRDGWLDDTNNLKDFNSLPAAELPYKPKVECKQLCSDSLITRNGDSSELDAFHALMPMKCKKRIEEFQFFLNDKSSLNNKVVTGAKCTRNGWEAEYEQP